MSQSRSHRAAGGNLRWSQGTSGNPVNPAQ
jgi:hypothetical protein